MIYTSWRSYLPSFIKKCIYLTSQIGQSVSKMHPHYYINEHKNLGTLKNKKIWSPSLCSSYLRIGSGGSNLCEQNTLLRDELPQHKSIMPPKGWYHFSEVIPPQFRFGSTGYDFYFYFCLTSIWKWVKPPP